MLGHYLQGRTRKAKRVGKICKTEIFITMNLIKSIRIVFIVVIWASLVWSCQNEDPILPLTVTKVNPPDQTKNLAVTGTFVDITFSRAISKNAANLTGVKLTDPTGAEVASVKTVNANGTVINIKPSSDLSQKTDYKVSVTGVATDDGAIVTPFTSTFTTVTLSLKVLSVIPANGAVDLQNIKQIVFTLDKKVANTKSNLDGIRFGEYGIDGVLIVRGYPLLTKTISADGMNIVLSFPEYMLSVGVKYAAALDKITAEDGSVLTYSAMTFTMKDAPLAIANISPANGATGVALDSKIVVVFNKQLKPGTVPGFTVYGYSGESWAMEFDGTKTVTFTCKTALKGESTYGLMKFGDIISATGEKLDKLPDYSFTTRKL